MPFATGSRIAPARMPPRRENSSGSNSSNSDCRSMRSNSWLLRKVDNASWTSGSASSSALTSTHSSVSSSCVRTQVVSVLTTAITVASTINTVGTRERRTSSWITSDVGCSSATASIIPLRGDCASVIGTDSCSLIA